MLKNTYKQPPSDQQPQKSTFPRGAFSVDRRLQIALGILIEGTTLFLALAFVAHFIHGKADQCLIEATQQMGVKAAGKAIQNWLGWVGATAAYYCVFRWLGIGAFFVLPPMFLLGYRLIHAKSVTNALHYKVSMSCLFGIFWVNLALGYADLYKPEAETFNDVLGGLGFELGMLFDSLLGWGTVILLAVTLLIFLVYSIHLPLNASATPASATDTPHPADVFEDDLTAPEYTADPVEKSIGTRNLSTDSVDPSNPHDLELSITPDSIVPDAPVQQPAAAPRTTRQKIHDQPATDAVGNYDPKLDLSSYQYPDVDLLDAYDTSDATVTSEELVQNKARIVQTLTDFKIDIASIKATIGPTVTLYEIVPAAGIKIAKIKNLEDDIALNLAALGIRIIAPIPGKGTIGIEVPNKNRVTISLRSLLHTDKFMKAAMELPIILGKTIANEVIVADLTRMPHLLIAGATGQGKSVGLNVLLASLVYKKHPAQLKLVLVDPKKVELSLYAKLERHFLAKLPSSEEPIITETKKVVNTLQSLCLEMDLRYELLKEAGVRNIKEYNEKFVRRSLNPEEGHRFLPYLVLVIDEFADMMMTAGKEVETPIARLAQLARAIGIYLVLATQRPSVNVITGIIKANFPVRISFRVTSSVDSRTILDTGGAEQLVGQGDMLLSMNSSITRLQCPFLDTLEVERICTYIGNQRGYPSAYLLPACTEEDKDVDAMTLGERDTMFEEAARLLVAHQQGSTSLIQRKLKLGYNRAGRIIDQLEAAGIVGPFEGSKAREVLLPDEYSLEAFLKNLSSITPDRDLIQP